MLLLALFNLSVNYNCSALLMLSYMIILLYMYDSMKMLDLPYSVHLHNLNLYMLPMLVLFHLLSLLMVHFIDSDLLLMYMLVLLIYNYYHINFKNFSSLDHNLHYFVIFHLHNMSEVYYLSDNLEYIHRLTNLYGFHPLDHILHHNL